MFTNVVEEKRTSTSKTATSTNSCYVRVHSAYFSMHDSLPFRRSFPSAQFYRKQSASIFVEEANWHPSLDEDAIGGGGGVEERLTDAAVASNQSTSAALQHAC